MSSDSKKQENTVQGEKGKHCTENPHKSNTDHSNTRQRN